MKAQSGGDTRAKLGFIGLGLMGTPMTLRLLDAGFSVTVWGRTPAKLTPVLEAGANLAHSAREVCAASDIVCLCVSDTEAVERVVFDEAGVLQGAEPGKLLIDHSSIRPEDTQRMGATLAERGMTWLDAPVSGGVVGAEKGTLVILAGGTATDFGRATPLFDVISQRASLMGPLGAGQTTKLINQLVVGCNITVVAEATELAQRAGIDPALIPAALAGGRADSVALQQWMAKMARRDDTLEGHLRTMLKDLDTVLALARRTQTALPVTAMATEIHRMLLAKGFGERDGTSVRRFYDRHQLSPEDSQ